MILFDNTILPIELAASITEHSRSVGRLSVIDDQGDPSPRGTAFLVDKDLILTAPQIVGNTNEWSAQRYNIDFEFLSDRSGRREFLDAAPYPWTDPAASALHSVLADAYRTAEDRLAVLAMAGVPARHLLQDGTPSTTWRQALEVAAQIGRTRAVVDAVLKDDSVAGFHDKIRKLLLSEATVDARPVAVDWKAGWAALQLDKPSARAPLVLGSACHVNTGDPVIIIQHPQGGYKQFVIEPRGIVSLTDDLLRYRADTTGGSSGAPVFDRSMKVTAIHFRANRDAKVNEGARIDLVKTRLKLHGLNFVEAMPSLDESQQSGSGAAAS